MGDTGTGLSDLPFVNHTFAVSAHFRANRLRDWFIYSVTPHNWWSRSDQPSPFSDLWLVEGFLCIFRKPTLIGHSSSLIQEFTMGLLILFQFWSPHAEFPRFPGIELVAQFLRICRHTADCIEPKCGGPPQYGPSPPWWKFSQTLNFRRYMVLIGRAVLVTNSWSDWADILWMDTLW